MPSPLIRLEEEAVPPPESVELSLSALLEDPLLPSLALPPEELLVLETLELELAGLDTLEEEDVVVLLEELLAGWELELLVGVATLELLEVGV